MDPCLARLTTDPWRRSTSRCSATSACLSTRPPLQTAIGLGVTLPRWSRCSRWLRHCVCTANRCIDLLWPDDTVDEAAPKLHKAAHFARKAIDVPNAVVLRGDIVALAPETDTTIDVVQFEEIARRALADDDLVAARTRPHPLPGRAAPRATATKTGRRTVASSFASATSTCSGSTAGGRPSSRSTRATRSPISRSMRRHAANGDRHAALRQFERLDRAMRGELGVAPGREAIALSDRLLAEREVAVRQDDALVGREQEIEVAERALLDAAAGRGRALIIGGPAGIGKTALLDAIVGRAREVSFRIGQGTSAPVEGAWPYAPVVEALGRRVSPAPHLARRARRSPSGGDRPRARRRGDAVDGRQLAPASLRRGGRARAPRVRDARACCSPSTTSTTPTTRAFGCCTTSLDRQPRAARVHRARPSPVPCDRPVRRDPPQPRRPARRHGTRARPVGRRRCRRARRLATSPTASPDQIDADLGAQSRHPVRGERARPTSGCGTGVGAGARREHGQRDRASHPRGAATRRCRRSDRSTPMSSSPSPACPRTSRSIISIDALAALVVEPTSAGYRFRHTLVRDALLDDVPPHRRRRIHRDAAERLIEMDASAARIAHHLLEAGESGRSRSLPVARGRDGCRDRRVPRRARAGRRGAPARHRSQPDDRTLAAGRPVERARRPHGRRGLPRGARRCRRSRGPRPAGAARSQRADGR